ncbi:MAG: FMN-binding protein [Microbacterium sp.]
MMRTAAAPPVRSLRAGASVAAVAGIVLLAGCSPATTDADEPATGGGDDEPAYADGTYTADGTYSTPESVETISVTVTLEADVITDVQVEGDPQKTESEQYQGQFIGGISDVVVGQDIDEISVSRVAGSSLTSGGFNDAIESIKADAAL